MRQLNAWSLLGFVLIGLAGPVTAGVCPAAIWAVGEWHGELKGAGTTVTFRFETDEDGCLTGTFDKPDQDAAGLPLSAVEVDREQVVRARSDALEFVFEGQYQDDRIEGQFQQARAVFVLDLERLPDGDPGLR